MLPSDSKHKKPWPKPPRVENKRGTTCSVQGVVFTISNDGGKTGVFWHEDVFRAFGYLSLYDNVDHNYCVVAVKKTERIQ